MRAQRRARTRRFAARQRDDVSHSDSAVRTARFQNFNAANVRHQSGDEHHKRRGEKRGVEQVEKQEAANPRHGDIATYELGQRGPQ